MSLIAERRRGKKGHPSSTTARIASSFPSSSYKAEDGEKALSARQHHIHDKWNAGHHSQPNATKKNRREKKGGEKGKKISTHITPPLTEILFIIFGLKKRRNPRPIKLVRPQEIRSPPIARPGDEGRPLFICLLTLYRDHEIFGGSPDRSQRILYLHFTNKEGKGSASKTLRPMIWGS